MACIQICSSSIQAASEAAANYEWPVTKAIEGRLAGTPRRNAGEIDALHVRVFRQHFAVEPDFAVPLGADLHLGVVVVAA